ncbi:hypothetical protein EUGRSUZ_E03511 [Eucalyptus grandis]|uniref:ADP-ribosyl cyclase/cyclic ADP-ribose hydrolase n=3 Tax=Eucalyptus grandis TaxID=71139 RepID=A0A059C8I2_EUCGR|nr:hypothetical protein EUGRSUZ_E03511 [Eucalyptus grandis]KAK3436909.1 hypothetical protein EUGRSUZ_E03511 [Eucalyptus grandis]
MERKEPTPSEDPMHGASTSSTSPHGGDSGGGTQKPKGNDHDVFLSSVCPMWSTLFDDLRHGLVIAGIDTFCSKDNADEWIPYVLPQCKISIPIFERGFVNDKSGLRELVHMWKCKRSSGQIVLPIFDEVGPLEVQLLEGESIEEFSRLEGRVDEMELGEWRKALAEVGSLRGWEAEKFAYGYIICHRNII